ncbi:hypothetical protein TNCV_629081 [Trichonephila clavipes]|nr:hypothetical protein TNCV_629081 [Trichonephila clavipes]
MIFGAKSGHGFIPVSSRKELTEFYVFERLSITGVHYCKTYVGYFLETSCGMITFFGEDTQQLKQMLIEEWAHLPQELLDNLVLSMERQWEAISALRGEHIPC